MTGPKITTSALCCECGQLRTVSAHRLLDRELKCAAMQDHHDACGSRLRPHRGLAGNTSAHIGDPAFVQI
jgi:hypothetical protein